MITEPFIEFPTIPTLYRYCSWQNDFQKRILTHKELYFANPDKFNDPFDCLVHFTPTGTKKDFDETLKENIARANPHLNRAERKKRFAYLKKQQNYKNPQTIKAVHEQKIRKKYGVISLTEVHDSLLLWSHYADSHRGMCLGIDYLSIINKDYLVDNEIDTMPRLFLLKRVNYYREWPCLRYPFIPPSIDARSADEINEALVQPLITKSIDWDYEKEWRLISLSKCDFTIPIESEAITAVYLGAKMPQVDKEEILEICMHDFPHARVFAASIKTGSFGLDFARIRL